MTHPPELHSRTTSSRPSGSVPMELACCVRILCRPPDTSRAPRTTSRWRDIRATSAKTPCRSTSTRVRTPDSPAPLELRILVLQPVRSGFGPYTGRLEPSQQDGFHQLHLDNKPVGGERSA